MWRREAWDVRTAESDTGYEAALPLAGMTVVALEQAVAAPLATRQLADWGARVIKVERPRTGDFARAYDARVNGLSSYFVWLNRSKESLTLDLKRPEAAGVLGLLLERSDVFVHNLAPGAVDRLGLPTATLRARFPRLVSCAISGYGSTGPQRTRKAYDLLVQSEAGLVSITGTPEAPSKAGVSVADIAAGTHACSAVLMALFARERTGLGAAIEVSLLDALGEWMSQPFYYTCYGGSPLERTGARHASIAPYGPFTGRDGNTVYLAIQNDREWVAFCDRVIEQPPLARDDRFASNTTRVQHREALETIVSAILGELPIEAIVARLDAAGIAHARLNTVEEFARHPQLVSRGRWRNVESQAGPLRALLPPATIDGLDPVMGPVPALGEHTATILAELGYDSATVEEWLRDGVI